eukprot:scaffold20786_cov26-Prasinocladus_malaysianus.AAC.1
MDGWVDGWMINIDRSIDEWIDCCQTLAMIHMNTAFKCIETDSLGFFMRCDILSIPTDGVMCSCAGNADIRSPSAKGHRRAGQVRLHARVWGSWVKEFKKAALSQMLRRPQMPSRTLSCLWTLSRPGRQTLVSLASSRGCKGLMSNREQPHKLKRNEHTAYSLPKIKEASSISISGITR